MHKENIRIITALTLSFGFFIIWEQFFPAEKLIDKDNKSLTYKDDSNYNSSNLKNNILKKFTNKKLNYSNSDSSNYYRDYSLLPHLKNQYFFENSKIKIAINPKGAFVQSLILKKYYQDNPNEELNLELIDGFNTCIDTFFTSNDNDISLPSKNTLWKLESKSNKEMVFSWISKENILFERKITINDDYLLTIKDIITNNSKSSINISHNINVSRIGDYHNTQSAIVHQGMIGFVENSLKEIGYKAMVDDKIVLFPKEKDNNWIGITDKYWLSSIIPGKIHNYKPLFSAYKAKGLDDAFNFVAEYKSNIIPLETIEKTVFTNYSYIGPKEISLLDKYEKQLKIKHLDKAVDFGILYPITKPIFYFLNFLFNTLGSMALAIIVFTFLFKLLMFPLALKSSRSMSKMKKIKPKLDDLQSKYKDDKQKLNVEIMNLYKKEKVNPAAGCLPIILQIPIMFALYKVLNISINMHHAPFWGWISDLSAKDPYGVLTLFGLLDWSIPSHILFLNVGLWPIIMGITAYIQQKMQPSGGMDPNQQKVMKFMPVAMVFFMSNFPVGVIIYWSLSNLLSILQQFLTEYWEKK